MLFDHRRPQLRFLAAFLTLSTVLVVAPLRPVPAQTLDAVRIGAISSVADAPLLIADEKGYFRDVGIAPNFIAFAGATAVLAPLGTGQIDVAGAGLSAGLYNAVGRGIGLKLVADRGGDAPGYGYAAFLVRKDLVTSGKVKTPADVRGMRVAEIAKGATNMCQLIHLFDRYHISYNDVEHVVLGGPEQVLAFKNGSIDAAEVLEPWVTLAVREGVAVKMAGADTFYPNEQITALAYSDTFIAQRRNVAQRFMIADDVVAILSRRLGVTPEILRAVTPASVDPSGHLNVKSLVDDYNTFKKYGLIDHDVSVAGVVDETFVNAAAKALDAGRK